MDDPFEGGCGDDGTDRPCPICREEELSPDFIAMVEQAAAQPGRAMTAQEAIEWIDSL